MPCTGTGCMDMTFNYQFEIAALLFMIILLLHFLVHRQIPLMKTRLFLAYLMCSIAGCVVNILSSIGCANTDRMPLWLNQTFAFLFFVMETVCCFLFFWYTLQVCSKGGKWKHRMLLIGAVQSLMVAVLTFATPFTDWMYYFDPEKGYVPGVYSCVIYYSVIGYAIAELIILIINRKKIRKSNQVIMILYSAFMICSSGYQEIHRELLLNSISRTVVLLLIYMSVQNPGGLVDSVSDRYNELAFRIMVRDKIEHRQSFTVVYLHLYKFNHISAVISYKNADSLLEQAGRFFAQVGGEENTYRTQTHEFAMILPADEAEVEKAVAAVRERFLQKWKAENLDLMMRVDIVAISSPRHFESISEMNALRDYMLDCATNKGTGALIIADDELKEKFSRLNRVEQAISEAIEKNSLEVYYQPIYSMKDKKLVAAEALARLYDGTLGNISPAEFIPIAEKNGTIIELGRQIFEKCCKFIAEELIPRPELGIRSVHVNLSVVQCIQPDMAEQFISIIEKYRIPPGMLNLELTERMTLDATDLMRSHMRRLGEYGVHFSLDDYGTGSSNCAYLIDYSFGMVKFDKQMMDSYFVNESAQIILKNEFKTLKGLGIDIVAEGIETKAQVDKLEEEDMNYIQGYYFAKPAPAQVFLRLIQAQNA